MTTLRHPHIAPPLEIEVTADAVAEHLSAGWILVADEEPSTPDSPPTGEGHTPSGVKHG